MINGLPPSFSTQQYATPPSQQPKTDPNVPPKKYVKINGVMQLNPEYKTFQEKQGKQATTALHAEALPVVSNMEQHAEYSQASEQATGAPVPLSHGMDCTIEMMQQKENCKKVGVECDEMVDGLGKLFAKHEVPMGLMNKLMLLSEFEALEFIFDDSGSMQNGPMGKTRWDEARARIKELIEVLAYVPTGDIHIRFLNRSDRVAIKRTDQLGNSLFKPSTFIEHVNKEVDRVFGNPPVGSTPILRTLQQSFSQWAGKKVSRYLFCDGEPSGGEGEKELVEQLVVKRREPANNPLTLLSCTEDDSQVEWMKELEEKAPYCAECDDFKTEAEEVAYDQGNVLPYTKGFYLICQLVGAMNPEDLDAMDESVPFTKYTLDNLLGVQTSQEEYQRYFDGFMTAQQRRRISSQVDAIKRDFNWRSQFREFLVQQSPRMIPAVGQFKRAIGAEDAHQYDMQSTSSSYNPATVRPANPAGPWQASAPAYPSAYPSAQSPYPAAAGNPYSYGYSGMQQPMPAMASSHSPNSYMPAGMNQAYHSGNQMQGMNPGYAQGNAMHAGYSASNQMQGNMNPAHSGGGQANPVVKPAQQMPHSYSGMPTP